MAGVKRGTEQDELAFDFFGGRPCLDFVATVAERRTTGLERLRSPEDFQCWIAQAHLLDRPPPVSATQLARAREVREALFVLVAATVSGSPIPLLARQLLNTTAQLPPLSIQMGAKDTVERSGDLEAVLSELVRDCFELLAGPQRAALSWCDDEKCTRVFLDTSRGRRRRWCGMSGCGDRAKAAAYRRRRAGVSPS